MSTDQQFAALYDKKLLPLDQLKNKFLDYTVGAVRATHQDVFSIDCVFGAAAAVTPNVAALKVDVAPSLPLRAASGTGKTLVATAADARLQGIKIPASLGTIFHIGIEQSDCETGIETNPRTGQFEYVSFTELMGRVAVPTSVTDNGNGTLTIVVNTLLEASYDHSGRSVRVWLKSRANGGMGAQSVNAAVAIQTISTTYSAPNNSILVPNIMGQTAASVTAADYVVMLIGPTVTRAAVENLTTTSGCLFLAAVTGVAAGVIPGGNIDTTAQNVVPISVAAAELIVSEHTAALNLLARSGVVSGFADVLHSSLNFTVGAGTAWIGGTLKTMLQTVFALTDATTHWIYLDSAGVLQKTASAAAFGPPQLPLYQITTAAGAITAVKDIRRYWTRHNDRRHVTVGPVNSDYITLEAAFRCVGQLKLVTGEDITHEIVVQGPVTMTEQIPINFPFSLRGVTRDGSASSRCKVTTPSGVYAFSLDGTAMDGCAISDLHFTIPTGATSGWLNLAAGSGDDWDIRNCTFSGSRDAAVIWGTSAGNTCANWNIERCKFSNMGNTGATHYIHMGEWQEAWTIQNNKFTASTGTALNSGVYIEGVGNAMDHTLERNTFSLGGVAITLRESVTNVQILSNHISGCRGTAIDAATDGNITVDNNTINNCVSQGGVANAAILVNEVAAQGGGLATITRNRIFTYGDGSEGMGISMTAGSGHIVERNTIIANLAGGACPAISTTCEAVRIDNNNISSSGDSSNSNAIFINNASATACHVTGNKIRDWGGPSGEDIISVKHGCVVQGNTLSACDALVAIHVYGNDNHVSNNTMMAMATLTCRYVEVVVPSSNNIVSNNIIKATLVQVPVMMAETLAVSNSGNRMFGNTGFTTTQDDSFNLLGDVRNTGGWTGLATYAKITTNAPNQSYVGGVTVDLAVVGNTKHQGCHIPVWTSLAPAIGDVQAGVRLHLSDGTSIFVWNTTGIIQETDWTDGSVLSNAGIPTNCSVVAAKLVAKNVGATISANLDASYHEGWVIG